MNNKELAKKAFEDILGLFNGTDIKHTDEIEDIEFKTHSYIANVINIPQYAESIKSLINVDKYEYDPDFNDYVKYTEYGQITIIIEDKYITIEVMYNDDEEDYFDENLIPIEEELENEEHVYNDSVRINDKTFDVVISEDSDGEFYNIYIDDNLFLQEPKNMIKNLEYTAFETVIDYYKSIYFPEEE